MLSDAIKPLCWLLFGGEPTDFLNFIIEVCLRACPSNYHCTVTTRLCCCTDRKPETTVHEKLLRRG